ncbi:MAG: class I SAM-dependent methyltransferase [Phycisphaerales bacterium]
MLRGFEGEARASDVLEVLRPLGVRAVYLKPFAKDRSKLGGALPAVVTEATPAAGETLAESLVVREVDWKLEVRLYDGLSTGVFLDQRENRAFVREWCAARGAGVSVLNTFAYTCAFSVAAARGGAATTSVDVSGRYLDWGKRNLALNGAAVENRDGGGATPQEKGSPPASQSLGTLPLGAGGTKAPSSAPPKAAGHLLPPSREKGAELSATSEQHRFARMGTFEFFAYARRKGLSYDMVILDPPSFGAASKKDGVKAWSSVDGYAGLVAEAAELARPGGLVLASTNTGELCRGGGVGLEKQIVKGLGRSPSWVKLPAAPVDFAGERDRFAARAFVV